MWLQIAVAIYNRMSLCSLPRHTDIHIQYTYMHTTLYLRIPRKAWRPMESPTKVKEASGEVADDEHVQAPETPEVAPAHAVVGTQVWTASGVGTPGSACLGDSTAALFALHDGGSSNGEVFQRATTATELLQALHFVPAAFRGSKWSGSVHLKISRSFSIGIIVDGERASVDYRKPNEGDASFLVITAERDVLMGMLEGTATVAMLVLSGAIHVDDWENALLFQEAFDFNPKAYAKWKEEQQYLLLRPRHSDEPTELAGGADLDEDVEASLQHVIAERARQAQEVHTSRPSGSTTFDLNSLLCCAARKVA